ncbi:MAG: hybrid sensor histidine kinase/response regulator [Oculatellaceae cyanobacterium Prado106]|jgi:chemosensory pili system protein ChpA (sensor histidine kinase/response regulator)|nr:hybrid sensor histidine kinase/response regulator [Oculatellaceae cyanobacterium Prado106]
MSQDKELEIRLQFLDEAQEYLGTLEAAVMGLSNAGVDLDRINAALRAAHSIKGGAGLMGYDTLSQLAHRLEDSFKVLKVQRNTIAITPDLEALLLSAVDCMNQVIICDRQNQPIDPDWLGDQAAPIFEDLYERLGEPQAEDASSILGADEGQDIVRLLFESEVDGCLQRLESALANQDPCLREEVEILAQELGGLGEMLQLTPFSQLCESVADHIAFAPDQAQEVAELALAAWRRSQALVLTGHLDTLPNSIQASFAAPPRSTVASTDAPEMAAASWTQMDTDADLFDTVGNSIGLDDPLSDEATRFDPIASSFNGNFDSDFDGTFDGAFDGETAAQEFVEAIDAAEREGDRPTPTTPESDIGSDIGSNIGSDIGSSIGSNIDSDIDSGIELNTESDIGSSIGSDIEVNIETDIESDIEADEVAIVIGDDVTQNGTGISSNGNSWSNAFPVNGTGSKGIGFNGTASNATASNGIASNGIASNGTVPNGSPIADAEILPTPTPRRSTSFRAAAFPASEGNPPPHASSAPEAPDTTVRVPSKQLDQLSDLFSELTIERNALDLHLGRLRTLIQSLSHRVQVLEQSNGQLREGYDNVATQADQGLQKLLVGSSPEVPPNLQSIGLADLLAHTPLIRSDEPLESEKALQNAAAQLESLGVNSSFDVLEMDRYSNFHLLSQEVMETIVQIQEVTTDIELSLDDSEQTARNLNKTSRQLQTRLTKLRMRPLSDILDRFPRALRELSLQHGKPVQLKITGGSNLVDRNILESLSDPLMHLLRNAFDHGIEPAETRIARGKPPEGTIEIHASHRNNRTIITLKDDGGGIPLDRIRAKAMQMGLDEVLIAAASDDDLLSLIFEPGFSTSEQVTSLSGRGVGMDVVRDRLRQVQGEITVSTEPGIGTTFTLSVPFTLTVTRVLIAESNRMLLAFPIDLIEEMILLPPEQVMSMAGNEVFSWDNILVQLIRLGDWLEFNCPRQLEGLDTPASVNVPTVLMLNQGSQIVGLQVEKSWGEQEVAIRKVEGRLPMPPGFSNCTILGDGRVVPLVDVSDLLRWIASSERARVERRNRRSPSLPPATSAPRPPVLDPDQQPTVLVVDDSINVRRFLALTLEKAGYQVAQAKDGQDALDKLSAGLNVQAVVCDIEMPRLDGFGFLARFRSDPLFEQIPVTMLTSRSGDKHRQLAISLGAKAYFSKPYNEQALLKTLEGLIHA